MIAQYLNFYPRCQWLTCVYITNVLWPFGMLILDLFSGFWQRCQWLTLCSVYDLNECFLPVLCVLECINECISVFYTIYDIFCYLFAFILQTYFGPLTRSSWTFPMAVDRFVSGLFYV